MTRLVVFQARGIDGRDSADQEGGDALAGMTAEEMVRHLQEQTEQLKVSFCLTLLQELFTIGIAWITAASTALRLFSGSSAIPYESSCSAADL